MDKIAPYAKSIVAAVVAGLGSLYQALDGDNFVSSQEWIAVVMTTLTALGVVFAIPNKDPQAQHQDESVQPPSPYNERGESYVGLIVGVLLVLILVVVLFRLV